MGWIFEQNPMQMDLVQYTLISLINVKGCKICQITKRGGWNKCGGWDFFKKLMHNSNKRGVEGGKI